MKTKGIKNAIQTVSKFWRRHGSSIKVYGGVVVTLVGTGFACKAAIDINKDLTVAKENLDIAKGKHDDKAVKEIKKTTAIKIVKKASAPVGMIVGGTVSVLSGYGRVNKEKAQVTEVLTTITTAFSGYRQAVIERFGAEVDRELRLGKVQNEQIEKTVVDENGNQVTEIEEVKYLDPTKTAKDIYTFRFDRNSSFWNRHSMDYNIMTLRSAEAMACQDLTMKGTLLANKALDKVDIKGTSAAAVMGWVNDSSLSGFDAERQVSFGIDWDNPYNSVYRDPATGEDYILINLNVDGSILEWLDIPKKNITFIRNGGSFKTSMKEYLVKSKLKSGIKLTREETEMLNNGIPSLTPEEAGNVKVFA